MLVNCNLTSVIQRDRHGTSVTADVQKVHLRGIFPHTGIQENHGSDLDSDLPCCPSIFVQTVLSENSQNGSIQQDKCKF